MQLINLTPHAITVINPKAGGENHVIPASGTEARLSTTRKDVDHIDVEEGFALVFYNTNYDNTTGLPDPQPGVRYIVSALTRTANPDRKDLASPAEFVRDPDGNVLGCKSFDLN